MLPPDLLDGYKLSIDDDPKAVTSLIVMRLATVDGQTMTVRLDPRHAHALSDELLRVVAATAAKVTG